MNCIKCGTAINPGERFCSGCGVMVETLSNAQPTIPPVEAAINPAPLPTTVEPTSNYQQPISNTSNSYDVQTKKNNTTLFLIIAVLLIAIIGMALYFLVFNKGDNNNSNVDNNETNSSTKVNLGDYNMSVPNNWQYEYNALNNSISIMDNDQDWTGIIEIMSGKSLSTILGQKQAVLDNLKSTFNFTVSSNETKTVSGKRMWVIRGTYQGYDCLVTYNDITANYTAASTIQFEDSSVISSKLDGILEVIVTLKSNGSSSNITTPTIDPTEVIK